MPVQLAGTAAHDAQAGERASGRAGTSGDALRQLAAGDRVLRSEPGVAAAPPRSAEPLVGRTGRPELRGSGRPQVEQLHGDQVPAGRAAAAEGARQWWRCDRFAGECALGMGLQVGDTSWTAWRGPGRVVAGVVNTEALAAVLDRSIVVGCCSEVAAAVAKGRID